MNKLLILFLVSGLLCGDVYATGRGGSRPLKVRESDGSPSASRVNTINVTNGKLTKVNENEVTLELSGTPGGSDTQVQYNDGSSFGGIPELTYDDTTGDLTIGDGGDEVTISPSSAASFSDKSITNVNDIALVSISADAASGGFDLKPGTATGDSVVIGNNLMLMQEADIGDANRTEDSSDADPHLRVYSSDEGQANDYIEIYHDQSHSYIESGNGEIRLRTDVVRISKLTGGQSPALFFDEVTSPIFFLLPHVSYNQITFGADNIRSGYHFIFTEWSYQNSNFDHGEQSNATIYLQGDTNPNVSNNQWISFTHDQEDGRIETGARVGTGTAATTNEQDIVLAPQGTEKFTVHGVGLYGSAVDARTIADTGDANPATLTLDPNTSYVEIDCSDSDSCDITMAETDTNSVVYEAGQELRIVNISTNTVDFADTAGVTEIAGAFAMGQWDSLILIYEGTTWIESTRSDN